MTVITLGTPKGGAGKTMICELLIGAITARGHSVAVVDADINETLSEWVGQHFPQLPLVTELNQERVFHSIAGLKEEHDLVVVDTAGAAMGTALYAVGQSDAVIIPVAPSRQDLVEAMKALGQVRSVEGDTGKAIITRLLLNAFKPNSNIAQHLEREIERHDLPLLTTRFPNLVAFQEMSLTGVVPSRWLAGMHVRHLIHELADIGALPFLKQSVTDHVRHAVGV